MCLGRAGPGAVCVQPCRTACHTGGWGWPSRPGLYWDNWDLTGFSQAFFLPGCCSLAFGAACTHQQLPDLSALLLGSVCASLGKRVCLPGVTKFPSSEPGLSLVPCWEKPREQMEAGPKEQVEICLCCAALVPCSRQTPVMGGIGLHLCRIWGLGSVLMAHVGVSSPPELS